MADWPRHIQYCIPVMVTEIHGMGKGLLASKDFKKGEVLFKEAAAIVVHAPSGMIPLQDLKEQVSKMSEEQKTRFYQLAPKGNFRKVQLAAAFRENCLQELDIFFSNSHKSLRSFEDKRALFLSPSLINHSCVPNVMLEGDMDSVHMNQIKVRAIKDISKGEEVTECYTGGFLTRSKMKTTLQEKFSFDCKCGVCTGSIPNQDRLILEISSIMSIALSQTLDQLYQKKKKEWMTEASQLERAAELSKQLYIGRSDNRIRVLAVFVTATQMARDPIRLKKAWDLLKEEISSLGLMESHAGKVYKDQETKLERWSLEFQSKRNPRKEEIDECYGPHLLSVSVLAI